jgi:hypothetical protein
MGARRVGWLGAAEGGRVVPDDPRIKEAERGILMGDPGCTVLDCAYRGSHGPFGAGKCGRNTERFHHCPCSCHWDGVELDLKEGYEDYFFGAWPKAGVGSLQEDGSVHSTHWTGHYQVITWPDGTSRVLRYTGSCGCPKWENVFEAGSLGDAREWVEQQLEEQHGRG